MATQDLDNLNSQVKRKAQELFEKQEPKVDTVTIQVEQQYVEEREGIEEYTEPNIIKKDVEVKYNDHMKEVHKNYLLIVRCE